VYDTKYPVVQQTGQTSVIIIVVVVIIVSMHTRILTPAQAQAQGSRER